MTVPIVRKPHPHHVAQSIAPNANPLVREFFALLAEQGVAVTDVAERSGYSHTCIVKWRRRHNPTITAFEAALNVLGYRLAIEPIPDPADPRLGRPPKSRPEGVSP